MSKYEDVTNLVEYPEPEDCHDPTEDMKNTPKPKESGGKKPIPDLKIHAVEEDEEADQLDHQEALDSLPLSDSIDGVSSVVTELKSQLLTMVEVNNALEGDLLKTRQQLIESSSERTNMNATIKALQQKAQLALDLESDNKQLTRERDRLLNKVHDLEQALTVSEQRLQETSELLDRFREERNDASEETHCLEVQFARAMKVIEELRSEIDKGQRKDREHENQIIDCQKKLEATVSQRDMFRTELIESRKTLKEIHQSLLDAGS